MVNTIIAKTNGKDKVIDFRDCLNLANQDDYAMMHGIGGEKHARTSVIKLTICDYTAGKGELWPALQDPQLLQISAHQNAQTARLSILQEKHHPARTGQRCRARRRKDALQAQGQFP